MCLFSLYIHIHWLRFCYTYRRLYTVFSLAQVKACYMFGTRQIPEIAAYSFKDRQKQNSVEIY